MGTSRIIAVVLVLLAGLETAAAKEHPWRLHSSEVVSAAASFASGDSLERFTAFGASDGSGVEPGERTAQQSGQQLIPPSMALRLALSYSPGSQGLGVDLVQGRRLVYAVKLKTGNRVHRVLVDARTGQILRD